MEVPVSAVSLLHFTPNTTWKHIEIQQKYKYAGYRVVRTPKTDAFCCFMSINYDSARNGDFDQQQPPETDGIVGRTLKFIEFPMFSSIPPTSRGVNSLRCISI